MAGFFTRTKHLDKHVANRVRIRAKAISDDVKSYNKRYGENTKDIDGPPMYELVKMFARSADTDYIYEWLCQQDTAFRDYVPIMVFNILKDNRYE